MTKCLVFPDIPFAPVDNIINPTSFAPDYVINSSLSILHRSRRKIIGGSKFCKRKNRRKYNLYRKNINDIQNIFNFSNFKLNVHHLSVLNKGLNFSPTNYKPKIHDLHIDMERFERFFQLQYYFQDNNNYDCNRIFEKNPNWLPDSLNTKITRFRLTIQKIIFNIINNTNIRNNLTNNEIKALHELKNDHSIIIRPADKGGGIVLMNSRDYHLKMFEHVNNSNIYQEMDVDNTDLVKNESDNLILDLFSSGFLNKKQSRFLTDFTPSCPIIYGIPKIHKDNLPLRPIVSQIDGPTSRIGDLIDKYLAFAESQIPLLLKDTTEFLQYIEKNKFNTEITYLVTLDVDSLYTNIPQDEAINFILEWYSEKLQEQPYNQYLINIDTTFLKKLLVFVLKNTFFKFMNNIYEQKQGTSMGSSSSVKIANIYMHIWFLKHLPLYTDTKPDEILRYIDDLFFFWNSTQEKLFKFFNFLNSCHPTIKFKMEFSPSSINFLDTTIIKTKQLIITNIYKKPTDRKKYLHYTSNHPHHVKKAIPFSQVIRYKRIISLPNNFSSEISKLEKSFLDIGYPKRILLEQMNKASNQNRTELLQYKDKKSSNFQLSLPLIIPYHQSLNPFILKPIINKCFLSWLNKYPEMKEIFSNEHIHLIFKRGVTLKNLLVKYVPINTLNDTSDQDLVNCLTTIAT